MGVTWHATVCTSAPTSNDQLRARLVPVSVYWWMKEWMTLPTQNHDLTNTMKLMPTEAPKFKTLLYAPGGASSALVFRCWPFTWLRIECKEAAVSSCGVGEVTARAVCAPWVPESQGGIDLLSCTIQVLWHRVTWKSQLKCDRAATAWVTEQSTQLLACPFIGSFC